MQHVSGVVGAQGFQPVDSTTVIVAAIVTTVCAALRGFYFQGVDAFVDVQHEVVEVNSALFDL